MGTDNGSGRRRLAARRIAHGFVPLLLFVTMSCGADQDVTPTAGDTATGTSESVGNESPDDGATTDSSGPTGEDQAEPGDDDQDGGSGQDEEAAGDEGVAWVPFGPRDPTFPTPSWPVYSAFARGDCGGLESALSEHQVGDFGRLMLALCFAAVEGRAEDWATVEELQDTDPSPLANDCLSPLVQDVADRALEWHRANPGRTPAVQLQEVDGATKCGQEGGGEPDPAEEDPPPDETGDTEGAPPDSPAVSDDSPQTPPAEGIEEEPAPPQDSLVDDPAGDSAGAGE